MGEWSGQGTDPGNGVELWRGELVLTITRVDGDRVSGTLEIWCGGGDSCNHAHTYRTKTIHGTLRENQLKIGPLDMEVDGLYMTGRRASKIAIGYARLTKRSSGAPQPARTTPPPGAAGSIAGVYAGVVCLGPSPNGDPPRCFRRKATVRDGKIAGGWSAKTGGTVTLAGEVATTGDVKIEWRAKRPDGSQSGRANLSGIIQNGRLDANGTFVNGRTVLLRWAVKAGGIDSSREELGGRQLP